MADFAPEQLEACLLQLTASNTDTIKQAEAVIKAYLKHPASVTGLMTQIQGSSHASVRQLAAMLLRQKINKRWPALDEATQTGVKQVLLQRVMEETESVVKSAIARLIAALARDLVPANQWPDLFGCIEMCATNANPSARVLAMLLLASLNGTIGEHLLQHFSTLKRLFLAALQDTEIKVRIEAMHAACGLVEYLEKKQAIEFQQLIDPMLQVLQACIASNAEVEACEFMDVFSELANSPFPMLTKALPHLVQLLLQIFVSEALEPSTRAAASSALNAIIDAKPKALAKANLVPTIFTTMLQLIAADTHSASGMFSTLLEADDADAEEDDDEPVTQLAQRTLDYLALGISPKTINPIVLQCTQECVRSADPNMQKAGVLALGVVSEGCSEFLSANVKSVLPFIYEAAASQHHSVREAACFSLGQFCEYLQPVIQNHHAEIVPVALALLDDPTPAVKATSCYVLEVFTESMEPSEIKPFLATLVEKLVGLIRSQKPSIQKLAISALGSASVGAKAEFTPYFQHVCELLQPFLGISDPKFYSLRGTAIECLGYLVVAMGAERFGATLQSIMPYVFQTIALNDVELTELSLGFIINSSNIYKKEFLPYVETCVQAILPCLKPEDGITIVGDDENELAQGFESDDDEDDDDGKCTLSIRTATLEMKCRAVECIEALASNIGGAFDAYVPPLLEGLSLLVEYIHEDVRGAVAEACAALIICSFYAANPAAEENQVWVQGQVDANLLHPRTKALLDKLTTEVFLEFLEDPEKIVVERTLTALTTLSATIGPVVTAPYFQQISTVAQAILTHAHICQDGNDEASEQDEDEEDDDIEGGSVLDNVTELLGSMAKCFGPAFDPMWQALFPFVLQYANGPHPDKDRASILGCFGEVLPEVQNLSYVPQVLPLMVKACAGENTSMQRNAAFALGTLVKMSGASLSSQYLQILQALHPLFESEDEGVVDNAASAVAKMIMTHQESVPLDAVLPVFLKALPLKADFTETESVFNCLLGLLQAQNPAVLNAMPQVAAIFAQSLGEDSDVDEEVQVKIRACVQWLVATFPDQMKAVVSAMDPSAQAILSTCL
ncbi:importin-like protein [Achlya hypogyna]|uniref:Importin-like protein n=1 Tax=Achlya hypogyna TaxID=1202772 RepID=A0A1V9YGZ1_ACHHY|nr:importin-like protein [Achlya hypogyna]